MPPCDAARMADVRIDHLVSMILTREAREQADGE